MSRCLARERADAEAFVDGLEAHEAVVAVDHIAPAETPTDRHELDVVCRPRAAGLPPAVADYCARYALTVRSVQPQADHWQCRLVVRD
jgi:hypothetical protein